MQPGGDGGDETETKEEQLGCQLSLDLTYPAGGHAPTANTPDVAANHLVACPRSDSSPRVQTLNFIALPRKGPGNRGFLAGLWGCAPEDLTLWASEREEQHMRYRLSESWPDAGSHSAGCRGGQPAPLGRSRKPRFPGRGLGMRPRHPINLSGGWVGKAPSRHQPLGSLPVGRPFAQSQRHLIQ